jgi:hypothetical protein
MTNLPCRVTGANIEHATSNMQRRVTEETLNIEHPTSSAEVNIEH